MQKIQDLQCFPGDASSKASKVQHVLWRPSPWAAGCGPSASPSAGAVTVEGRWFQDTPGYHSSIHIFFNYSIYIYHTHTHIYIYIYIYIIHTYIYIYLYIIVPYSVYIYIHICIYWKQHEYIYIYILYSVYIYIYTHVYICAISGCNAQFILKNQSHVNKITQLDNVDMEYNHNKDMNI